MRISLLIILMVNYINGYSQAEGPHQPISKRAVKVMFETFADTYTFIHVGDSLAERKFCKDYADSCFKVRIFLLDKFGSCKIKFYDSAFDKVERILFYKGRRNKFIYDTIPIVNMDGDVIERQKIKFYTPVLKSVSYTGSGN